ncbi:hypothetical protein TNCV_339371 [Trichonephila clavipes]|nr:hypothetical protein TNCV_339371 [Trichonephila clavipes]
MASFSEKRFSLHPAAGRRGRDWMHRDLDVSLEEEGSYSFLADGGRDLDLERTVPQVFANYHDDVGREVKFDYFEEESVVPYPIEGLLDVEEGTPGSFSVVKGTDNQKVGYEGLDWPAGGGSVYAADGELFDTFDHYGCIFKTVGVQVNAMVRYRSFNEDHCAPSSVCQSVVPVDGEVGDV